MTMQLMRSCEESTRRPKKLCFLHDMEKLRHLSEVNGESLVNLITRMGSMETV